MTNPNLEARLRGALWSFFAGDALAAPTHWYYGGFSQVRGDYGSAGITDYTKPKRELRGSILNKSDVNGGGRSGGGFFSKKPKQTIIGDIINHGKKDLWDANKSIHYHATLAKGENTLEAQLARVLMKTIVENDGKFNPDSFRSAYVNFMTTPGSHNDTYASTCHRMFFANMVFQKLPPEQCPDNDGHNVDTVDGLILPTIAAMAYPDVGQAQEAAAQCASVTRKSNQLNSATKIWSQLVHSTLHEQDTTGVTHQLNQCAQSFGMRRLPNADSHDQITACYLSQSVPPLLDMVAKYLPPRSNVWDALIANANVGGENVHRGSILGAVLGARAGVSGLPPQLMNGLHDKEALTQEIDAFVAAVLK